nr:glucose/sorbosone family PQQ-dependent dehydrogenase [uncultured Rhodoferax sp.]
MSIIYRCFFGAFGVSAFFLLFPSIALAQNEHFSSRVVSKGFNFPWEITWGPDSYIWVTERTGKKVTRVHPITGAKSTATTIPEVYQSAGQDGLLGMALHNNLLRETGEDYVFVAFTYSLNGTDAGRRMQIRRYAYDKSSKRLKNPVILLSNLPASYDHNSGRLKMGPDGKLYYTMGDQGANQFNNRCKGIVAQDIPTSAEIAAQDWTNYVGKILRINTDGSIPADNPVISGVRSHIYSYGHRNVQGIAFSAEGNLYANEHGPRSDDEINQILPGKNYGWPRVAGYNDNKNYQYINWSSSPDCSKTPYSEATIPKDAKVMDEGSFSHPDFQPPLLTLFTKDAGYTFPSDFIQWPTVAPASLDYYQAGSAGIPNWDRSLFTVSLKKGLVYRTVLGPDGTSIIGDARTYWYTKNRYRDIAMNPDKRTFYIATDNTGSTSGPSGKTTSVLTHPGAILEFKYSGKLGLP